MAEGEAEVDLVGQAILHFRVTGKLGEGGMGVVYRATDEKLGRTVALKVLPPSFAGDADRRARFLREARSAAAVTHANLAAIYEVGEADGRIFIAMELVEGKTLRRILEEEGRPPLADVLRWAKGIARGIAKAHDKGIVHRDLKPDNVMIDEEGHVKVLDFGLAKVADGAGPPSSASVLGRAATQPKMTQDGGVVGTPEYMSPEQARGAAVDLRTDVFSFGIVLYEMLVGKAPFAGASMLDVLMAIARDTPKPIREVVKDVPPEVEAIVERCLKKEPAERFASGREVLEALRALEPARPSSKKTTTASAQPAAASRAPSRPWGRTAALAALAGVLVVAAGVGVVRWRGSSSAAPSPSGSSSASHGIADVPAPRTSNPQAAKAYENGMRSLRDAQITPATHELEHAVHLDPNLAAAHLALALEPAMTDSAEAVRHHVDAASRGRAQLTPRDAALLPVAEARAAEKEDREQVAERAKAAAAQFPKDPYVAVIEGQSLAIAGHADDAKAAFERAVALEPTAALPLWAEAVAREELGDEEGAMKGYDACTRKLPSASSCVRGRLRILNDRGQCADLEAGARRLVSLEPNGGVGYFWLARALAGKNAPVADVREAMQKQLERAERDPGRRRVLELSDAWRTDALAGDFAAAERTIAEWTKATEGEKSESVAAPPWYAAIRTYLEEGDEDRAEKAAEAVIQRSASWTHDGPRLAQGLALSLLHGAHKLADADFKRLRAEAVEDERKSLQGGDTISMWVDLFAVPALTRGDAQAALQDQTPYGPLPASADETSSEAIGRVLVLASWWQESMVWLKAATQKCSAPLEPMAFVHAHADMGHALEKLDDKDRACAAYGAVLDRWGKAKPRSVTADDARARRQALHCGS